MNFREYITSKVDLWEMLEQADRPIVLYGMGNGADKIIEQLEQRSIKLSGVFASDDFVRYQSFHGFTVQKYDELHRSFPNMIVLVSFGTQREDVLCNIKRIAKLSDTYAPDVAVIGKGLFTKQYALDNLERIEAIYRLLDDELSKKTLVDIIGYKITGDIQYLFDCEQKDFPIELTDDEIFMDLGAYTGDTVLEFVQKTNGKYRKIYAVEPDVKNYKKLLANTEKYERILSYNICVSDKQETLTFAMNSGRNSALSEAGNEMAANSVDNILSSEPVTYIKFDVEGQEAAAIRGATCTINNHSPKMKIAVYHRFDDILAIPEAVLSIKKDYRILLRHRPYVPAWDTDCYFVQK